MITIDDVVDLIREKADDFAFNAREDMLGFEAALEIDSLSITGTLELTEIIYFLSIKTILVVKFFFGWLSVMCILLIRFKNI